MNIKLGDIEKGSKAILSIKYLIYNEIMSCVYWWPHDPQFFLTKCNRLHVKGRLCRGIFVKLHSYPHMYMPVLRANDAHTQTVRPGVQRRLIHTDDLMIAVIDFDNGPWDKPDPAHSHVHEQVTYVAEGEIIFFCEGEDEKRLLAGDMFSVPSGRQHTIQLMSATAKLIDAFTPIRQDFLK